MEMLFTATNELMDDCLQFAKDSSKGNDDMYARRGQTDGMKTMMDRYYGKLGEFAVAEYLTKLTMSVTLPDMKIYEVKDKSYDADLICEGLGQKIHVKCCEETENPSWVFQRDSDPLVTKPDDLDYIAVTVHSVDFPVRIQVLKVFKAIDVVNYYDDLYSEEYTKRGKCALYWDGRNGKDKQISKLENAFSWDIVNL